MHFPEPHGLIQYPPTVSSHDPRAWSNIPCSLATYPLSRILYPPGLIQSPLSLIQYLAQRDAISTILSALQRLTYISETEITKMTKTMISIFLIGKTRQIGKSGLAFKFHGDLALRCASPK